MKKIIKIGIQDNEYPVWLSGEVDNVELDRLIRLLQTIKSNRGAVHQH